MAICLSLGSNIGRRRETLEQALVELTMSGVVVDRVSPVVESPALLPAGAPSDWQRPFLNLVAECRADCEPTELLGQLKTIERKLGREGGLHWAPRPIDIDILLWNELQLQSDELTIPHSGLAGRAFVLAPLAALSPGLKPPGFDGQTALELLRALGHSIPLWMGIVNLTPDSFSDGGRYQDPAALDRLLDEMLDAGVHIVDFGAESTRPGAAPVSESDELSRLQPAIERLTERLGDRRLRPLISVDTYHPMVAREALAMGADIINDVSGLTDPSMLELAATSDAIWVAMHSTTIPADPMVTLPTDEGAADQLERWLDGQLVLWSQAGIPNERIVFDPGIGFGKTALQSIDLLQQIDRFVRNDIRLLVGHSRKSFMKRFVGDDLAARDDMTLGISMELCRAGVDIVRVHDIPRHLNAYRGWVHARRA